MKQKLKKQQRIILQRRDLELLKKLTGLRLLDAVHIHELIFPKASLSAVYRRLRKLTRHNFIEVIRIPAFFSDEIFNPNKKLYTITKNGIQLVNNELDTDYKYKKPTLGNLYHDYIAVDFLCSLETLSKKAGLELLRIEDDRKLWTYIKQLRRQGLRVKNIVSDASVTFQTEKGIVSFHLEVVNAYVSGGNRNFFKKLERYAWYIDQKQLQGVFKQERVRAILVLTTSKKRIKNMQAMVSTMGKGKNLFWFSTFKDIDLKAQALDNIWVDYQDNPKSILEELF